MSLCQTFRDLSFQTWRFLEQGRKASHQPLEETVTDKNIIELKLSHPNEILTKTYNRRQEASTGADWQWWFTNRTRNAWYGARVQAKILKFQTDRFEALNYKNQTSTLIHDAQRNGLVPLYCFYSQWPTSTIVSAQNCQTFANSPDSYGCSIVDAYTIQANKSKPGSDSLVHVIANAFPWSCLVCCNGTIMAPNPDLPNRVKSFIDNLILQAEAGDVTQPQIVDEPPDHIAALLSGEEEEIHDEEHNLAGVIVVMEGD